VRVLIAVIDFPEVLPAPPLGSHPIARVEAMYAASPPTPASSRLRFI
jgi:hypothetical protein